MRRIKQFLPLFVFALFTSLILAGCVNYEQKATINSDGSGTMKIHYWAASTNISSGELGGFGFTEDKARSKFSSSNTQVGDVKIEEKKDTDTTKSTHVTLDVKFKDLNKLTEATGFSKIKASWEKGKDGMDFKYTLLKDTSNSGMGMEKYKLAYEFEFADEVIASNGKIEGKKVTWDKNLTDLKQDVVMSATVKSGKKCGLFGLELPIIVFAGVVLIYGFKRKR
ncbi:MAG TPA: hypothetical protein VIL99_15520 [Ignavibacteria bacterium]|jgi:hypothetical protein